MKDGVALSCMLVCFAFFFTIFVLKYNCGKISGEGIEGGTREKNGSDIYKEQTYLVLAIQAVNPGISGQAALDAEADCVKCSL